MTKDEAKLLRVGDSIEFYFKSNGDTIIGVGKVVETRTRTIFNTPVIVVRSKLTRYNYYFGEKTNEMVIDDYVTVLKPKEIIRKV